MILSYYPVFIKSRKNVSRKTMQALNQTPVWLEAYEQRYGTLTFGNIDLTFYDQFHELFLNEGFKLSTVGKHIKHIKQFMRWAWKQGLHKNEWALSMKVRNGVSDEQALTSAELLSLWETDYMTSEIIPMIEEEEKCRYYITGMNKRHREFMRSRDFFYALCSSGMYPENLKAYNAGLIKDGMVVYHRNKRTAGTYNLCRFPFADYGPFRFKTLAEQYDHDFDHRYRMYMDLRVMLKYVGIDKKINTRCGRRTFASIGHYELGWDESTVKLALGHTQFSTSLKYLRIDEKVLAQKFCKSIAA